MNLTMDSEYPSGASCSMPNAATELGRLPEKTQKTNEESMITTNERFMQANVQSEFGWERVLCLCESVKFTL
jgi:hypothetical protein